MFTDKVKFVDIHSWEGLSPGAQHYYGSLYLDDNTKIEIKRPLTEELAIRRDKETKGTTYRNRYKLCLESGEIATCNAFYSEEELIEHAIKYLKDNNIEFDYVLDGDGSGCPCYVIAGKEKDALNKIYKEYDKISQSRYNLKATDSLITKWEKEAIKAGILVKDFFEL